MIVQNRMTSMGNAPFGNCKIAVLQRGNDVQSFGGLIAIDKRTQLICACSTNIADFTDRAAHDLLGQHWSSAFRADQLPSLFKSSEVPGQQYPHVRKYDLPDRTMLIASHSSGDVTLISIVQQVGRVLRLPIVETQIESEAMACRAMAT